MMQNYLTIGFLTASVMDWTIFLNLDKRIGLKHTAANPPQPPPPPPPRLLNQQVDSVGS